MFWHVTAFNQSDYGIEVNQIVELLSRAKTNLRLLPVLTDVYKQLLKDGLLDRLIVGIF